MCSLRPAMTRLTGMSGLAYRRSTSSTVTEGGGSVLLACVLAGARDGTGRACVLGLLLLLIALVPLADCSPPDPVWIAGIYDAADSDDAVVVATSLDGVAEQDPLGVSPVTTLGYILAAARVGTPTATASGGLHSRAPPTS